MKMTKTEVIQQVLGDIQEANQQVRTFQSLADDVLRYRPRPDRWSVLDCLEHINLFYADYFSRMEPVIRQTTPPEKPVSEYTPGFFAQKMVDGLRPRAGQRKMKIKTFKKMTPATDEKAAEEILNRFFRYHTQWEQLVEQAEPLDWNRVRVASAIGPILRFKLGDCFRLLMAHTERHLLQSQEVLATRRSNRVHPTTTD